MTKKTATKTSRKPNALKVERVFDASPQTLWSYWTDPDKFAKWFNPAPGIDLVVHEYDVREGGRVRFDMPQPDGNKNPQEGVFHVLKPYREIISGSPDKSFLISVTFAKAGKKTRMTVRVTGVPAEYHAGATKGWNAGFDKLEGLVGGAIASEGFTIERTVKAPIERLWELWTTKHGVESWWGPEGFSTTVQRLDLRPGGIFDIEMRATAPEQIAALEELGLAPANPNHSVFLEVTPPRRLALRTRIDFVPGVAPYEITSEVEFREVRGGTRLVFRSSKMHSERWMELARQGQMSQLDKLARVVGGESARGGTQHPISTTLPSDREILITRVFDAPRERVFRAHVDRKSIEEWWGPREYTTRVDRWEPRAGGAWRVVQHAPDGTEHAFRGVFQEVVPSERMTWTFEYEPLAGHVHTETVTFEEQPGGRTKLTVRAVFPNREDRDGMVNAGMEWGLRQSYEQLDEFLTR